VVSSYHDEDVLELRTDGPRSKWQSARLLKDYRDDVVADMTLPQQLMKTTIIIIIIITIKFI